MQYHTLGSGKVEYSDDVEVLHFANVEDYMSKKNKGVQPTHDIHTHSIPGVLAVVDEADMVNHPPHYTKYTGFEVIDIVEQLDYLRGNAVKYILRAEEKWNTVQDIDKAIWYLTRYRDKLVS